MTNHCHLIVQQTLGLVDTAANLATDYTLGAACDQASGLAAPSATGTVGAAVWRYWDYSTVTDGGTTTTAPERLLVCYRNVFAVVFVQDGATIDREGFAKAFIADVDGVS